MHWRKARLRREQYLAATRQEACQLAHDMSWGRWHRHARFPLASRRRVPEMSSSVPGDNPILRLRAESTSLILQTSAPVRRHSAVDGISEQVAKSEGSRGDDE